MFQFVSSDPRNSMYLHQNVKILDPGYGGIYKKSSSGIVPTLQKSGIDNGKVGLIMGECN